MQPSRTPGIRARGIILALVLIPASVAFMAWGNWIAGGIGMSDSLLSPAVAGLVILVALNAPLRRWRPQWALSAADLIAAYVVLVMSVGMTISCYGWGSPTAGVITWPIWNATPENEWQGLMWPNLASWLTVWNRDALAGFYLGDASPYRPWILLAWLRPALWWAAWVTALLWVSLCLNVIVRRRWSQEEQLPFPMTILPLEVTAPRSGLLANPLFWIGAAGSAAIAFLGLARVLVPGIPVIPTSVDIGPYLVNNPPWDALRTPLLAWEPWHLGLAYLMPVDLAFSLIVFNLFWRAEYVLSRLLGWTMSAWGSFPYGDQQSVGGYLGLTASVVWLDRRYLVQVLRKALGLPSRADDKDEPFSYRKAVLGAIVGLGFLWYFLARAGMSGPVAVAFLLLYFAVAMAISRMRAHLGPPSHDMWGAMPDFALTQFPGTRALGASGAGDTGPASALPGRAGRESHACPDRSPADSGACIPSRRTPLLDHDGGGSPYHALLLLGQHPLRLPSGCGNVAGRCQPHGGSARPGPGARIVAAHSGGPELERRAGHRRGLRRHAGLDGCQASFPIVARPPGGLPPRLLVVNGLHDAGHHHHGAYQGASPPVRRPGRSPAGAAVLPRAHRGRGHNEPRPGDSIGSATGQRVVFLPVR